jgi:WD40 repeat protein
MKATPDQIEVGQLQGDSMMLPLYIRFYPRMYYLYIKPASRWQNSSAIHNGNPELTFSPDGLTGYSTGLDGALRVWDLREYIGGIQTAGNE